MMLTLNSFKIKIHFQWSVLLLICLAYEYGSSIFLSEYPNQPLMSSFMGIFLAIAILLSIIIHELAHVTVGRLYGMTFDGIELFFLGGAARMTTLPRTSKAEFLMAIAGPVSSGIIAFSCFFISIGFGFLIYDHNNIIGDFILLCSGINTLLALFNLIPFYPLDGGRVMHSIIWYVKKDYIESAVISLKISLVCCLLLCVYGFSLIINSSVFSGLWIIMLSFFIYISGRMEVSNMKQSQAHRSI